MALPTLSLLSMRLPLHTWQSKADPASMKTYEAPICELLVLSTDVLMASDENELAIDKLSSIFDF